MPVDEYQALIKAARAGAAPLPGQPGSVQTMPNFDDMKRDPYSPGNQQRPVMNIGIIRPSLIQATSKASRLRFCRVTSLEVFLGPQILPHDGGTSESEKTAPSTGAEKCRNENLRFNAKSCVW